LQIVLAALDRPQGNCVNDQPGFEPGLDREQAAQAFQHQHWLSKRRANRGVPPFLA
jgi:hypothetical protein